MCFYGIIMLLTKEVYMGTDMLAWAFYLFMLAAIFDISLNLRRLIKNLERIWRKLAEINDALKKNSQ